jgi:tRNA A37 methylthiotransferase MiaB
MAKILLWNSLATRRRSASDTFLDNGLGRLKAYLENRGHEVILEDWATDSFYSHLAVPLVARPLRALYKLLLSHQAENFPSALIKLLGAGTIPLQWLQSLVQRKRMKSQLRRLALRVAQQRIPIVGIKVWYGEAFAFAKWLGGLLQEIAPEALLVAGGYHATLYEEDVLRFGPFDIAITGEGEYPLSEILSIVDRMAGSPKKEILEKIASQHIENTLWRNGGNIALAPKRRVMLEQMAIPSYGEAPGKVRIHVIVESVGCAWGKCNFCVHPYFYNRYAPRDVEELVGEMKAMVDQGMGMFRLAGSDTPPAFGARIGQVILDAGLRVIYGMGSRAVANCSEPKIFQKTVEHYETMIRSGLRSVFMGGETGHDRINKEIMNKGITRADLVATSLAIREAEKRIGQKLDLALAFIYPVPLIAGVTQEEVFDKNLELISEFNPDSVIASPPAPFKQSRWYSERERFGFEMDESIIPIMMEYEYVLYKPPNLWPKLNIGLQGRNFVQILNECLRFRKSVERMNIPTDLSDEHFLMLRSAGFIGRDGAQRFKKETLLDIVSCDYRQLTEISKKMNTATRRIAEASSEVLMRREKQD